ncbi:hypothetical protein AVEN_33798-1 [Araneus ventricosus]|uniref:Uncharacterized protein n=1 Tax=Araneus ventricosus TaxID=182803 RepID=A0A4Y2NU68_ARAVE|nr:hypothetical protein AVEN_33798-1 [Araneus ventricosus]
MITKCEEFLLRAGRHGISSQNFYRRCKIRFPGYEIEQYAQDESQLPPPRLPTDGLVFHSLLKDTVYKLKETHTLDVVYHKVGWFLLPDNKRFQCRQYLEAGCVYELSMVDGD